MQIRNSIYTNSYAVTQARGVLNLHNDAVLEIVDMHGRKVYDVQITDQEGNLTINSSTWSSGFYVCNIRSDDNILLSKKLMFAK